MTQIILASASPARKDLLQRLKQPFTCLPANIDESRRMGEDIEVFVQRLALEKAQKIAQAMPNSIVIGSDEVMVNLDKDPQKHIGKPHTKQRAIEDLLQASNCHIQFLTALCVIHQDRQWSCLRRTDIQLKSLSQANIEYYIEQDQPLSCAGAFRSEGLGIALCTTLHEEEPGSLMGLPLLSVCDFLQQAGISVLTPYAQPMDYK